MQGYPLGLNVPDLDQYEYQPPTRSVAGKSSQRPTCLVGVQRCVVGLTERQPGRRSVAVVQHRRCGRRTVSCEVPKVHTGGVEKCLWTRGHTFETCQLGPHTAGFLICYDLVFPEAARMLALRGAEILLLSTAWARSDDPTFARGYDLFTRARALENQVYLVAANLVDGPGAGFHGHSRIVDPAGVVLSETAGGDRVPRSNFLLILTARARVGWTGLPSRPGAWRLPPEAALHQRSLPDER